MSVTIIVQFNLEDGKVIHETFRKKDTIEKLKEVLSNKLDKSSSSIELYLPNDKTIPPISFSPRKELISSSAWGMTMMNTSQINTGTINK